MARKIKIRAKEKGGTTTVKFLLKHPMETGLRKDKKTGKKIPAHFISDVDVSLNGTNVMTAYLGPACLEGPLPVRPDHGREQGRYRHRGLGRQHGRAGERGRRHQVSSAMAARRRAGG